MATMAESWLLHLRAKRLSIQTQRLYLGTLRDLTDFLSSQGMPTDPAAITGEHLREYFAAMTERGLSAKTVYSRHSFLRTFWQWMVDEGEVRESPMARIGAPKLDETLPPIVTDEQFAAMLATCHGKDPNDRRDAAILRTLEATGVRRAELAALTVDDFDRHELTIRVRQGKGRRERVVPVDPETAVAIDRYLRERARQRYARSDALFLARTGPMAPNAVGEVVYKRAKMAGFVDANGRELVSPHMFRHRFADRWKADGGTEDALMALGGWRNRDIMARYGRTNRARRAVEEYRRLRG